MRLKRIGKQSRVRPNGEPLRVLRIGILGIRRAFLVLLVAGLFLSACAPGSFRDEASISESAPEDAGRWVSGVLHVHSSYSDGADSVDAIARAAANAGVDFVVVNDHWSLDGLEDGKEGYAQGVLRLVGTEATTDVGHVLGFDLPPSPMRFGRDDPGEVLRQIVQLGGFAVAAHPDADREALRWRGWSLGGYQGIEVFNAYSAYRRNGILTSLAYLFINPFWQTETVNWDLDWDPGLVETWDRILPDRKLSAWAGADAHGGFEVTAGRFVEWPSYERVFAMARNYLLLESPLTGVVAQDRQKIYQALRESRGYVALNDRPEASQFRFWAELEGQRWPVGSDFEPPGPGVSVTMHAGVPMTDVQLRLFRDGTPVAESLDGKISFETDLSGVYRVEARIGVRHLGGVRYEPWIISNPISMFPRARIEARKEANRNPEVAAISFEMGDLQDFPLKVKETRNEGCRSMELVPEPFGAGSFRVHFDLGSPTRGEPDLFTAPYGRCGAEDRRVHDLTGYAGIHFRVRSDAIYRVNIQLADPDPAPPAGGSGWTVSFLTDRDWQEITIPFSRFRGIRERDPALDVSAVRGIAFMFDTANARPGTSGMVEVQGFSLIPVP